MAVCLSYVSFVVLLEKVRRDYLQCESLLCAMNAESQFAAALLPLHLGQAGQALQEAECLASHYDQI